VSIVWYCRRIFFAIEQAPQIGESVGAIGVDGCPWGWVLALAHNNRAGRLSHTELTVVRKEDGGFASLVSACEALPNYPTVAVDVPIGLPDIGGLRACDREARAALGTRWACVFHVPDRGLFGLSFGEAKDLVLKRRGPTGTRREHPKMSHQTIEILPKIEEVDRVMRADLSRQDWVAEVHPEVCFLTLAQKLRIALPPHGLPNKKTRDGRAARLALLRAVFRDVDEQVTQVKWRRDDVGLDDMYDAYVALWTARRYANPNQRVVSFGSGDVDAQGLLRRMVA
jgi:predicted RNase H-like nuclease